MNSEKPSREVPGRIQEDDGSEQHWSPEFCATMLRFAAFGVGLGLGLSVIAIQGVKRPASDVVHIQNAYLTDH